MLIKMSEELPFPAAAVWAVIGDPSRADWVPSVSSVSYDGECRRMDMAGAGTITEQIFRLDNDALCIEYGVVDAPVSLDQHRAVMQLTALAPELTLVDWQTEVLPDAFAGFIEEGMQSGLVGLRDLLSHSRV